MPRDSNRDFKLWEWITLFGSTAIVIGVTEWIDMSQKWEDAIVFSVMLFLVVSLTLQELWTNPVFWRTFVILLVFHLIGVAVLVQMLPVGRFGFPKLTLIAVGMVEGVIILGILWRSTRNGKSTN